MSDSMREEFKAWALTDAGGLEEDDFRWKSTDRFYWATTQMMWEAWKASRESLVIPSFRGYSFEGCQYYDADVVDDALSHAGLKAKP